MPRTRKSESAIRNPVLRGLLYNSLAKAFGPETGAVRSSVGALLSVAGAGGPFRGLGPAAGKAAAAARAAGAKRLLLERTELFDRGVCPPYEYTYKKEASLPAGLADIAGFYAAFGLKPVNERPDHIVSELEFMALLCYKEAVAVAGGEPDAAGVCRDAQRKFIAEHLDGWLGLFAERLLETARLGFYPALANVLVKFVAREKKPY